VIEISKLSYGCGSGGGHATVGGKVVKIDFADDGVWIKGFVLEKNDGETTFINVVNREDLDNLDMVDRGYVVFGLQHSSVKAVMFMAKSNSAEWQVALSISTA
jgi:hypothetical protein